MQRKCIPHNDKEKYKSVDKGTEESAHKAHNLDRLTLYQNHKLRGSLQEQQTRG